MTRTKKWKVGDWVFGIHHFLGIYSNGKIEYVQNVSPNNSVSGLTWKEQNK